MQNEKSILEPNIENRVNLRFLPLTKTAERSTDDDPKERQI